MKTNPGIYFEAFLCLAVVCLLDFIGVALLCSWYAAQQYLLYGTKKVTSKKDNAFS